MHICIYRYIHIGVIHNRSRAIRAAQVSCQRAIRAAQVFLSEGNRSCTSLLVRGQSELHKSSCQSAIGAAQGFLSEGNRAAQVFLSERNRSCTESSVRGQSCNQSRAIRACTKGIGRQALGSLCNKCLRLNATPCCPVPLRPISVLRLWISEGLTQA